MTPHVRAWWDQDVSWTMALIEEKYGCYVQGFKRVTKPMHAFVMEYDASPIGYIQYCNVRDWVQESSHLDLSNLPASLAAIDVYVGEEAYIGKGVGAYAIRELVKEYVFKDFDACIVDPNTTNTRAIRAYEKAGFKTLGTLKDGAITMMVWRKPEPSRSSSPH